MWLTHAQMAELFQKDHSVVARHINNVFKEGELEKMGMCKIYTYHSAWRYEGLPLCLHKTAFSYTKLHFPA